MNNNTQHSSSSSNTTSLNNNNIDANAALAADVVASKNTRPGRFLTLPFTYDHSWSSVTLAIFNKYPNPYASHVKSSDVIERHVDSLSGCLHTTRLVLKSGSIPSWGKKLWNVGDVYVLEQSVVDPKNQTMVTVTRNLSHRKLMLVEETQRIKPFGVDQTMVDASARIISNTSWKSLRGSVERFGFYKGKSNMMKSSKGLKHVLETLAATTTRQKEGSLV